jgi:hypothetical protein
MMIPTIHFNGTGSEALKREIEAAVDAVGTAMRAVGNMTVHGRDYYPQGPDAFGQALTEHQNRRMRLLSVLDELVEMYNKLEEVK